VAEAGVGPERGEAPGGRRALEDGRVEGGDRAGEAQAVVAGDGGGVDVRRREPDDERGLGAGRRSRRGDGVGADRPRAAERGGPREDDERSPDGRAK